MATIYSARTGDRGSFVDGVSKVLDLAQIVKNRSILIKPNIVSAEPYPTTTHPETLRAVLNHVHGVAERILVADGPAFESEFRLESHDLAGVCKEFNLDLVDLSAQKMRRVQTSSGFELEVSDLIFEFDVVVSLPVLKSHCICSLTGALKNQYGLLSSREKRGLHFDGVKDIHKAIAELTRIRKPDIYVVDAVETLVKAQERRHGGKRKKLGYMFAGTDPVALDSYGLELLKQVEKRLKKAHPEDIQHIKHAVNLGLGETEFSLQSLQ